MSLARAIEPEELDHLPADDPRAIRHRRDLKRINAIILQSGIMAGQMVRHWGQGQPRQLVDLGSGDGTFMLSVARRLSFRWPGVSITLVDQRDIVSLETRHAFAALGWSLKTVSGDVFAFLEHIEPSSFDIISANLFIHHFPPEELARLLALIAQRTRLFVACEPRRSKLALRTSRLLWMIGCSKLATQDAVTSVRAGFRGSDLSVLWPKQDKWDLDEHKARLFTHCFAARRS
jgi:hypothetical protein